MMIEISMMHPKKKNYNQHCREAMKIFPLLLDATLQIKQN